MSSRKMVIHGWYGNGNLGDEIILNAMLRDLRRAFPRGSFTVITNDPEETARQHGVNCVGNGGTLKQRLRRFRAIADADLFILGGGGILGSYGDSDNALLAWLSPLRLAQELGVPTMTWGVGVGDRISPGEEAALKNALRNTDAICLRDRDSIGHLGRTGVHEKVILTADPAILFPEGVVPRRSPRDGSSHPRVSVFVRHWYVSADRVEDGARWKDFRASLAHCLDSLVAKSVEVTFIPMRIKDPVDDDREVANDITRVMVHGDSVGKVDHLLSPSDLVEEVARSDLVMGMRLHSLILAAALGVPLIAFDYHPKVRSFVESLGIADWLFEIGGADSAFIEAAEEALSGGYPGATVRTHVDEAKRLARRNLETATSLMNSAYAGRGGGSRVGRVLSVVASRLSKRGRGRDGD